jgi:hypothetical protein
MLLRVLTGRSSGKTVAITGPQFVVGRSRGCDLVLRDETIDDRHAVFRAAGPGRFALEDLESRSGTFVGGIRIRGTVDLRGDEPLCFGETFASLAPGTLTPRSRRRTLVVGGGVAAVLAAAGVTAAVLAPHTGSGPALATIAAPRAAPPAQPAAAAEPAPSPVPAPAVTTTGAEGEQQEEEAVAEPVVFRDDFSDPGSGWEVFDEPAVSAGYEDGQFVMRVEDSRWYATADSGRAFEGPVVDVAVSNPQGTATAGFGIVCHYLGQRRFHALAVGTDGTFAILRQRGDRLTVLTGGGAWAPSELIPVGADTYDVRAECRDGLLRLLVDGSEVATARTQAPAGRVGLFMAGLAEFRFDDFVAADRPSTPS